MPAAVEPVVAGARGDVQGDMHEIGQLVGKVIAVLVDTGGNDGFY